MKYLKRTAARFGLDSPAILKNYLAALLWAVLLIALLGPTGQATTFLGAALTAAFFYALSHLRNTYLESQLRFTLESALNYSTATFDEFHIMVRNRTWVPITVREIRFRKSPEKREPGPLVRLKYKGPSYCVTNNDPDEEEGDYLPHSAALPLRLKAKMGLLDANEKYAFSASPEPGDFHPIPPEAGAVYALPFSLCEQFMQDDIRDCLMVVEYPTIFGRKKIITAHASEQTIGFIQRSLRKLVPMMRKQEKEMLEQERPENAVNAAARS